jgi:hypothetical protein
MSKFDILKAHAEKHGWPIIELQPVDVEDSIPSEEMVKWIDWAMSKGGVTDEMLDFLKKSYSHE